MNIVCAADSGYVQHCSVMLIFFFENNPGEEHAVYLLTEGLDLDDLDFIQKIVHSYNGHFFYCQVDFKFLEKCPIKSTDHLSIATYNRLFMADLLPADVNKVLYLDCDIIVNQSIKELWETPLRDNFVVAAFEERGCCAEDVYERLDYDSKYGYFNAGVLLVNLDYWRTHNMTQAFIEYIEHNFEKLRAHDQDVLNAFFYDKSVHISLAWNVEFIFYYYGIIKKFGFDRDLRFILRHPKILHFTWKPKPWETSCQHPFRINYYRYLKKIKKNPLSFRDTLRALWDKYYFCFLIKWKIKGHKYYKLV